MVVLPALDPKNKEEPLFDLAGGPGAASTDGAFFYAREGKEYRRHRDVVLVDQRGTGKSNGLKAEPRRKAPQDYLTEMYPVEYVKRLRETLEPRADLTNTPPRSRWMTWMMCAAGLATIGSIFLVSPTARGRRWFI